MDTTSRIYAASFRYNAGYTHVVIAEHEPHNTEHCGMRSREYSFSAEYNIECLYREENVLRDQRIVCVVRLLFASDSSTRK